MANSFPRISAKTDRLDTELRERGFWGWLRGKRGPLHNRTVEVEATDIIPLMQIWRAVSGAS
jgi:hypothetical protein